MKIKTEVSKCCNSSFETKSNGLWNYHVCNVCGGKAEVIKVWNKNLKN
jgi:hypothetical protein|tara:strand:- start:345 stop:488 length:144 start_codon:yes stop_codon:yes gene_type:complete